jgi:hypothetical protein
VSPPKIVDERVYASTARSSGRPSERRWLAATGQKLEIE